MKVSFHPEVKADLRGSYDYYREIDPELGIGFIEEYRKALAFVKRDPLVMRTFYKNDRRMPLKRFKSFALVYEVLDTEIRVKAVADLRRKPYFWSER
jgi:hypothetical protein